MGQKIKCLLRAGSRDLAGAGIDQMHSLAGSTGDRLVCVFARLDLFGRPALHELTRVRTTEHESAHTENVAAFDIYQA